MRPPSAESRFDLFAIILAAVARVMASSRLRLLVVLMVIADLPLRSQASPGGHLDKVIIGGFDTSRAGLASFTSGSGFTQARSGLFNHFPATIFTDFPLLTRSNLLSVDVLVIGVATAGRSDASPLSTNEQGALWEFIKEGGSAVLFTDNDSFAPQATNVNRSFLLPFGTGTKGTLNGPALATVPDPGSHPVTSGPFGSISSIPQFYPGGITSLGAYAQSLATNSSGCAMAIIEAGAIAPGSGRVVIFSDISGFWESDGYFPANSNLVMNVVSYVRQFTQHSRVRIAAVGTNVVLRWPGFSTNVVLEATTSLDASAVWSPVLQSPALIEGESFVTNPAVGTRFYRLRERP